MQSSIDAQIEGNWNQQHFESTMRYDRRARKSYDNVKNIIYLDCRGPRY